MDQPLKNVLIWTAGGPGSGKTTLLHNLSSMMKNDHNRSADQMLVIGNTLINSLQISVNSLDQTLLNAAPIMIDNRCIDEKIIMTVLKFANLNAYRTVLIYPWINYETFCRRMSERKKETGRDYKLSEFWKKHQIFHKIIYKYITSSCPFDICLIYDNNNDHDKPLIYVKIGHYSHLINPQIINQINNNNDQHNYMIKEKQLLDNHNRCSHPFIPKENSLPVQLKLIFDYLFKDLMSDPIGHSLHHHIQKLISNE